MKGYLLDTNALLWIGLEPSALKAAARDLLFEAALFVSVVSAAEIAIKAALGKLRLPPPFQTDFGASFRTLLTDTEIDLLPLDIPTVSRLRHLPLIHRDPFDRLIIAQALQSELAVATRDRVFSAYAGLQVLDV